MRVLQAKRRAVDMARLRPAMKAGTCPASERDYELLITEPTVFMQGAKPLVAYVPFAEPEGAYEALARLSYVRDYRTRGLPVNSRTLGYLPRNPIRRPFCTTASSAKEFPAEHALLTGACAREAAAKYAEVNQRLYMLHMAEVGTRVQPAYLMPGTPFTSAIANDTLPINYHFDGGNFKGLWSAMFVLKRDVAGGHLVLPELGVALECADRTLVLFDGQGLLHGVTPIRRLRSDGHRFTCVYYSMEQMWKCLAPTEEVKHFAKLRTERERRPRAIQAPPPGTRAAHRAAGVGKKES